MFFIPIIFSSVVSVVIFVIVIVSIVKAVKNKNIYEEVGNKIKEHLQNGYGEENNVYSHVCDYCGSTYNNESSCPNCGAKNSK